MRSQIAILAIKTGHSLSPNLEPRKSSYLEGKLVLFTNREVVAFKPGSSLGRLPALLHRGWDLTHPLLTRSSEFPTVHGYKL